MSFLKNRRDYIEKVRLTDPKIAKDLETRQTGASLGLAFKFVGQALRNPGKTIHLYDYVGDEMQRLAIKRVIIPYIRELIKNNKLEGFTLNPTKQTIRYKLL